MAISTLTAIFLGISAAGTAVSAIGSIKAGNAQKRIAEFNAAVAEQQAVDALARGAEDEANFRAGVRGLLGTEKAGFAAQGVDIGVGSPVDVQEDTAFLGELDALTIRTNAAREAWGYEVEAENFRRGGAIAQTTGRFQAATTILGTGASLLSARLGMGLAPRTREA